MRCPFCDETASFVRDSREIDDNKVIRRRRECSRCLRRFTTFEKIQLKKLMVVKRSGIKKPFDPQKITKSIEMALRKRAKFNQVEEVATKVIASLENVSRQEINSQAIGKMIMQELAKIDHVAYIRFASVYHDFTTAEDFVGFIKKMTKD